MLSAQKSFVVAAENKVVLHGHVRDDIGGDGPEGHLAGAASSAKPVDRNETSNVLEQGLLAENVDLGYLGCRSWRGS
jgi:hypothetical protein